MTVTYMAPWHKTSFERFLHEKLPQLLTAQLPLADYRATETGRYSCDIAITLSPARGREITVTYTNLPQPDDEGLFEIAGQPYIVVPYAEHEELASARIVCVGEQLLDYIQQRLGKAPAGMMWDEALIRAWLPLDTWMQEFFTQVDPAQRFHTAQLFDQTNWLARKQHLRRLFIRNRQQLFTPGHMGRTCPFETPEGPNIAHILVVAVGAEIRDEKLVIVDDRPEATLGLSASMIPFLEKNSPRRLLMGANMMRQWLTPPDPEPALVQSGNEPENAGFWCGRNLLTAYIAWGEATFEEGIVLSESAARKLNYPAAIEPGDKLSDRHGTKGVVSRILPDAEMPRLQDGTPVELIFHSINFHTRLYLGPIQEAVASNIAQKNEQPLVVKPLHAPDAKQLQAQLRQAGLAETGQQQLLVDGQELEQRSTVGWVYWGKLIHTAESKIQVSVSGARGQRQGTLEYHALNAAGAIETIKEQYNTRATTASNAATLVQRVSEGPIEQNSAPTPSFAGVSQRLAVAGIRVELRAGTLALSLGEPEQALELAQEVTHPWLPGYSIKRVGEYPELAEYQDLVEANQRLKRSLASNAPASLLTQAQEQFAARLQAFFAALLPAEKLNLEARVLFSGRAVLTPGTQLQHDQVGIPDTFAWELFGPIVARKVGSAEVQQRSQEAATVLDEVMHSSWVMLERSPASTPQAFLAFHPVRSQGNVLQIPALACRLLQADFDGDQAAIFLPLTASGQREAAEQLSIIGHLTHQPEILPELLPRLEAMWGLAYLSLNAEEYTEIKALATLDVERSSGIITQSTLGAAMEKLLRRDGAAKTLAVLERLTARGFAAAQAAGASIAPFIGCSESYPVHPGEQSWEIQEEALASSQDYKNDNFGNQLLAVKSGACGEVRHVLGLTSGQPATLDVSGKGVPIQHGYRDGLSAKELYAQAVAAREAFAYVLREIEQIASRASVQPKLTSYYMLARALRSQQPGVVFAHAAASGEVDPLTDRESRLFVGL